ncbi:MAG: VIT1/CCC1 transporter family protein [Candidatus Woesearchaeota archaeon]
MDHSLKIGISFGLTSSVITTLGLMVGLYSGLESRLVVIGGILTIAIADAASDALGIHISEESENKHSKKEIWTSTLATFLSKFLFALTFLIPILLLELQTAIFVSVVYGLIILALLTYYINKSKNKKPFRAIAEHIVFAMIVIITTYFVGIFISNLLV